MHRRLDGEGPAPRVASFLGVAAEVAELDAVSASVCAGPIASDVDLLRAELAVLATVRRRVETRLARATAALTAATVQVARAADPDDCRAGERAARAVRRELAEDLRLTPSQVRTAERVGARAEASPALATAMAEGTVSAEHARLLDDTLRSLAGAARDRAERDLLAVAIGGADAREFGRECRRILARLDAEEAEDAEARRHRRRRGAVTQTPDGMTVLSGQWSGLQAELVHTAIHAFRRPDVEGEHRTAEQRTADAVADALRAALEGGRAPTQHGVRPHMVITADLDMVCRLERQRVGPEADGTAEGAWTGPLLWTTVRRILDDASLSFLVTGPDGQVAVTDAVRTVPVALHRSLVNRDGGCIHHRCDMPPPWTQVMHLGRPYRDGGKLSTTNAALGCAEHHRQFDRGELVLHWDDHRPVLRPPP